MPLKKLFKKTIVLRAEGGLGNQMFQYAFARTIQKKYGGKILFDLHTFKKDDQRDLSLQHFKLNQNVDFNRIKISNRLLINLIRIKFILLSLITKVISNEKLKQKSLSFFGIFFQKNTAYKDYLLKSPMPLKYLSGNWMSEKYFLSVAHVIKNELNVITEPSLANREMIFKLQYENSVCVHIRRGDYTNSIWEHQLMVCDFDYYDKAINYLRNNLINPKFYAFSNSLEDIEWIKQNYNFNVPINYIDFNNPDYEELRLMYNCKHFILSNSSFSWWSSYLAKNENKIVVAPSKWNTGVYDMKAIYIDSWHIINLENE